MLFRSLREAVELRRTLETEIAVLAARNISDGQLAELGAIVLEMAKARDDADRWVAADVQFHMLLAQASGNTLITFLIEALRSTMEETIRILHAQRPMRDQDATFRRHQAIHDAIAAHSVPAARLAMEAHFAATEPVVSALIAARMS